MLVLTRKAHESIMIGDDIELSVLSVTGEKVRLGLRAPRDVRILRKEIYLQVKQQEVATGSSVRQEVNDALKRLSTG
jgi:carbon storage regulator